MSETFQIILSGDLTSIAISLLFVVYFLNRIANRR